MTDPTAEGKGKARQARPSAVQPASRSEQGVFGRSAGEPDVLELVHQVMHLFRSRQYQVLQGGAHEITHMETKVLGFYARQPGATQSDLVLHSGRDKAQLARLIKGLRERGLLDAEADASDRRHVQLRLTPQGQALQRTLRQQARRLESAAVAGLEDAERDRLIALLQRVKDNLAASG